MAAPRTPRFVTFSGPKLRSPVLLLTLGVTLSLVLFAAPRPTRSRFLPLPHIDFAELAAREREESARRTGAPLSVAVRRAGERFRRLGAALASQGGALPFELPYRVEDVQKASFDLEREIEALRGSGRSAELLELRSIQSDLFVRAVRRFEREQKPDADLVELGGDFGTTAAGSWFERGRLIFSDRDLRLLFRIRFGRLTGTHEQGQFGPSDSELRYFQALFLLHPPGSDPFSQSNYRLGVVSALEKTDPSYPAALTRALLLLDQAQPEAAGRALAEVPRNSGAWAHIANNTLIAASALHSEL